MGLRVVEEWLKPKSYPGSSWLLHLCSLLIWVPPDDSNTVFRFHLNTYRSYMLYILTPMYDGTPSLTSIRGTAHTLMDESDVFLNSLKCWASSKGAACTIFLNLSHDSVVVQTADLPDSECMFLQLHSKLYCGWLRKSTLLDDHLRRGCEASEFKSTDFLPLRTMERDRWIILSFLTYSTFKSQISLKKRGGT